ncbi:hypothetical protein TRFO_37271 [Tritrichomonas foetus]|uniref:Sec23/Sec24 helical domain-containing protein n=1 Tax=Tritrichomonas foetus TaxID=1144522 RepID=A0A1J4JG03_9EUKA|nr:hypothetical protein TRFO_37271 [Tritrichomonas foetus]|eukprot:OHS96563.1 hypothetical protein TRFO_37271 [Tritrichomonas foetus]
MNDDNKESFAFSASLFPRAPDRQDLIHIPLSLSLFPFNPKAKITPKKLNICENCNSYLFQSLPTENRTPTFMTCPFCQTQSKIIDYESTPSYVEWNTSPSPPPSQIQLQNHSKTLILIDGSNMSRISGFFEAVLKNLPKAIPQSLTNFLIASFNASLTFLAPSQKLFVFPTSESKDFEQFSKNDGIFLPPSVFHQKRPNSVTNLLRAPRDVQTELKTILMHALNIVGEHGRVVLILASKPLEFFHNETKLELLRPNSINFNPDWSSLQKRYMDLYARVDILVNLPSSGLIDLVALHKFCSPMKSRFLVMNNTQFQLNSQSNDNNNNNRYNQTNLNNQNNINNQTNLNNIMDEKTSYSNDIENNENDPQNGKIGELLKDLLNSFVAFVKIIFPRNLKSDGMVKFNSKANNVYFSMNSSWCKTIMFEMTEIGEKIFPFQVIITYRKFNGETVTRVFSKFITSTDDMRGIFNNLNQKALLKHIVIKFFTEFYKQKDIKDKDLVKIALENLSPMFRGYRNHVSLKKMNTNELVLPDQISLLPLYCLGAIKSSPFSYGILSNERIFLLEQMEKANLDYLWQICYPTLTDLTVYLMENGELNNYPLQKIMLDSTRIYMLYDGFSTWIWVGKKISQHLLQTLFKCNEFYEISEMNFQQNETEESIKLFSLVKKSVKLCLDNGIGHQSFLNRLIEDQTMGLPAYTQFLGKLQSFILQGF